MKKFMKIFNIIIITVFLLFLTTNISFANEDEDKDKDKDKEEKSWQTDYIEGAGKGREWGGATQSTVETTATNVTGAILTTIRVIGTGISIIMISYVGIKYMMAAPDEKAEYKKTATAVVVGAVVLFAGSNIIKIIGDFATKNI